MKKAEEIKVALFEDSFYPVIDGVVKVVDNYAEILNQKTYSCVVCPKPGSDFNDQILPYDVYRMPAFNSKHWQYSVAVPGAKKGAERLIHEIKPDILHVHSPFTQRTLALKIARELNIPVVATFHTKYYDDIYQATKSKLLATLVVRNIVSFYQKCDSVWACSEGTADTLRSYGYKGEITIMPNGTGYEISDDAETLKQHAAAEYGITKEKKNLLFIGTQVWQKNMRLVLDTMRLVADRRDDVCLWVIGSGRNEQEIRQYASKLGLTKKQVRFLGRIEEEKFISGVLLNMDLFFFPSVYDNAPIVVREAAVLKVPSLLVKGSNAADVINPDINGFVAEENAEAMAGKILSVIADEACLSRTGEEAAKTIPIPWEDVVERVYKEYASIIDRFKSKRS